MIIVRRYFGSLKNYPVKSCTSEKQATLEQTIYAIIVDSSVLMQAPATATGELEEHFENLIEQANELKTVNKKKELQELDAALNECIVLQKKNHDHEEETQASSNEQSLK
ncbi:hypothetical protein MRX96_045693 [Rhipicephalus microplus]